MLCSLTGVAWWLWGAKAPTVNLPTAKATQGNLQEQVMATGKLTPKNYVEVGAQVSGQLMHLFVEVGDEVTQGQVLAEIDARVLEAKVAASRAQIRAQAAQLKDRHAQLKLAQLNFKRQTNLFKQEAVTEESLQQAEASFLSAQAAVEQLEAQIEQNQSTLTADEANLEYTKIIAPISGTVVAVNARQGQTLNANQQAPVILQLADLTQMRVETEVSEADISRLKVGMPAYFTTLGSQGRRWEGELLRIEPTPKIENNVVLYNAPFDVANPQNKLLPEMTAQVFYIVAEAKNAVLIPTAALNRSSGQPQVTLLHADGRQETRNVQLGVSDRIQVEIVQGVAVGDTLVLQVGKLSSGSTSGSGGSPLRLR